MVVSGFTAGRGYRAALLFVASIILVGGRRLPIARRSLLPAHFSERTPFLRSAVTWVLLLFLSLFPAHLMFGSEVKEPKRVLILYSFDKEQAVYADLDDALRSTLRASAPDRIEFYTEYLDLIRFNDPGHIENLVKILRLRLLDKKPDVIMPLGYTALNFFLKNRKELFPEVPVVALFAEPKTGLNLGPEERALVTGVKVKIEPARTLDLALQLQPDTQRVVVVAGDSPNERFWLEQLRTDLAGYAGRVTFTYLADLPVEETLKQLKNLPPHTIILYTFFSEDARGQFFLPEEALDLIANASNVPIYGLYSSYIGHGVVGGGMDNLEKTGTAVANLAVRVLGGEKPADIPIVVDSWSQDRVDWRQLKRWGISERRLPPGSVVMFKDLSTWDRYRSYIIGLLFLLVFEAFLILALMVQRQQRKRAENRLLSEKAFSDAVIESLPGIFFMQDETLKNVRWNKNAEKIVRYHPSQVERMGNVVEKDRSFLRQKAQEVFEKGISHGEIELLGQGGATHHYRLSAHRVELEGKLYAIGIGIDISERKRAEDELRLSEARFFSAFEHAPIGMALVAPDTSFIKVNRTLCELLGYTPEELHLKTFKDVTYPDDVEASEQYAKQVLAGDVRFYQIEKRYIHKSGRLVWVWLSTTLIRDSEGEPLYFISQIQDITERKRAEENLKQAEERFSKAFRSNPEGFSITTLHEGRYLEANDAFLRTIGYERSEVIGKTSAELRIWEESEERSAIIAKLLDHGSVREEDVRFRTKAGKIHQIRLSAVLIQLQGEVCLLGVSRDVTEQNLLEDQLRQAQKMEAVGRLAGGVAHDFNNLLGVIIGYSELVSSALPADSAMRRRVEAIKQAGQRAASLTTQLLAFSRKQSLQPRVVNLNSVVTETEKLLRPLLGEDIECTTVLDPKLGRVKADAGQIVQVIMNLAVNARDAMPRGGKLIIETANASVDEGTLVQGIPIQPGFYVTLVIKDTGTGMDEETSARIFEPFFTTKPVGKGTGLGLATVYGIVEQSGGCIVVDTAVGEGTVFTIYLPRTDEIVKASAAPAAL